MVKKENSAYGGNSLLKTASNKRLGAGRFALLALKGNPKPPIKKVKIPLPRSQIDRNVGGDDDRSKVSDMTISVGESSLLSRPALIKEVQVADDIDVESSVLDMSMKSGINSADFEPKDEAAHTFAGLTMKSTARNPFANIGTSVKTPIQPFSNATVYQKHPSNRTVSHSLSHPKGAAIKRTMTLNKGIKFSAPSPMTLNRFEVQFGQEHAVPESKEYREQQAIQKKEQDKFLAKERERQAKLAVKKELKEEFKREQGEGFEAQLEDTIEEQEGSMLKKKSLVKKILGKIRPLSPKKKQNQRLEESSLDKQSATAMARRAILASKQKTGLGTGTVDYPIAVASPQNNQSPRNLFGSRDAAAAIAAAAATADIEMSSTSVPFPVNEILMQPKQDSISDLDASFRHAPLTEIRMDSRDPQSRDDESVSTLGTPRVFQKLDTLLRDPNPDPPMIDQVESMPPPPMVLSQDANPLADDMESAEISEGTAAVEKKAVLCSGCFVDPHKAIGLGLNGTRIKHEYSLHAEGNGEEVKARKASDKIVASVGEVGEEGVEAHLDVDVSRPTKDFLLGEKPMFDEVQMSSPKSVASKSNDGETKKSTFSMALDQAIKEASTHPNGENQETFPDVQLQTALSPIEEEDEIASPKSARSSRGDENKSPPQKDTSPAVIDLTDRAKSSRSSARPMPVDFGNLMEVAATKLEMANDKYATEKDQDGGMVRLVSHSSNAGTRLIVGHLVEASTKVDAPVVQGVEVSSPEKGGAHDRITPRTRGGTKAPLFDLDGGDSSVSTRDFEIYEDEGGDMVICSDDPRKLPKSPRGAADKQYPNLMGERYLSETLSGNFSDGLFDLLPSDEGSAKKELHSSQKPNGATIGRKSTERGVNPTSNEMPATKTTTTTPRLQYQSVIHPPLQENAKADVLCGANSLFFIGGKKKKSRADATRIQSQNESHVEISPPIGSSQEHVQIINVEEEHPSTYTSDQAAEEGKVLLDHDDAYWDTLSTIASTKDKSSSDSEKYLYESAIPRPIPIEITMANKNNASLTKSNNERNPEFATRATNTIDNIIDEKPSKSKLTNWRRDKDDNHKVAASTSPKGNQRLSRAGSALSGDEEIVLPPTHESLVEEEDSASKGSRVADLIAVFESSKSQGSGTTSSNGTPGENTSKDEGGLILAVTRSESGEVQSPEQSVGVVKSTSSPNAAASPNSKSSDKPRPEMLMEMSKRSKNSLRSGRSVSWGYEEIYESRNNEARGSNANHDNIEEASKHSDTRNQSDRAILSAIAAAAAGSAATAGLGKDFKPDGSAQNNPKLLSHAEEQNLLARTLELSKGLFGSINAKDLDGNDKEIVQSIFSFGLPFSPAQDENKELNPSKVESMHSPTSIKSGASEHSPIDVENLQKRRDDTTVQPTSTISVFPHTRSNQETDGFIGNQCHNIGNNSSPSVRSKLDVLREQRSRAFERFQLAKPAAPSIGPFDNSQFRRTVVGQSPSPARRDRNRLQHYSRSNDHLRATVSSNGHRQSFPSTTRPFPDRFLPTMRRDVDALSTTSSASSSAPSQKARELRQQLDEALKASKEIRVSQEQLGTELRSFKSRYYRKNDEIEDHALQAITRA